MTDLIERQLHVAADPAELWEALTDPQLLTEWLADEAEIELRVGGEARFVTGERIRTGWVEEVSPPGSEGDSGRLVFWWGEDGEAASRVELELTATNRGTRLRVVETRPLEVLDLVGVPLGGHGARYGPALIAA